MAVCEICKKVMPGDNPSLTIRVGHPVAKGWKIIPHYLIKQSPRLIKHAVMMHVNPVGGKSEQITDDLMRDWLKTKEESYGHGDWLLCPKCSVLLTPSKKVHQSDSNVRKETLSAKKKHERTLTHQSQRALYLREDMLQCIVHGVGPIISSEGYMLAITPETAQWAMPYSKRIVSAREHFVKGNFEAALAEYQTILRELPDAAIVLNDIGVCHGEMGHDDLAYEYIQKALLYVPEEKRGETMHNLVKLEKEINNISKTSENSTKNLINIEVKGENCKEKLGFWSKLFGRKDRKSVSNLQNIQQDKIIVMDDDNINKPYLIIIISEGNSLSGGELNEFIKYINVKDIIGKGKETIIRTIGGLSSVGDKIYSFGEEDAIDVPENDYLQMQAVAYFLANAKGYNVDKLKYSVKYHPLTKQKCLVILCPE